MKRVIAWFVAGTALAAGSLVSVPALAEQPAGQPEVVHTIPVVVIRGRIDKPHVVIELTRPTAARAATAAHHELRTKLLEQSVPKTLAQPATRP